MNSPPFYIDKYTPDQSLIQSKPLSPSSSSSLDRKRKRTDEADHINRLPERHEPITNSGSFDPVPNGLNHPRPPGDPQTPGASQERPPDQSDDHHDIPVLNPKTSLPLSHLDESSHNGDSPSTNCSISHKKNHSSTYLQKIEVLDWYHSNGKNQSKTAQFFSKKYPNLKIKQPLISSWLKYEDQIRSKASMSIIESNYDRRKIDQVKRIRERLFPKIHELLREWLQQYLLVITSSSFQNQSEDQRFKLTDELIKEHWKNFATLDRIHQSEWLSLSTAWLNNFKEQNLIKNFHKFNQRFEGNGHRSLEDPIQRLSWFKAELTDVHPDDLFDLDVVHFDYYFPIHPTDNSRLTILTITSPSEHGLRQKRLILIGTLPNPNLPNCLSEFDQFDYYYNLTGALTGLILYKVLDRFNRSIADDRKKTLMLDAGLPTFFLPADGFDRLKILKRPQVNEQVLRKPQELILKTLLMDYRHRYFDAVIIAHHPSHHATPSSLRRFIELDQVEVLRLISDSWNRFPLQFFYRSWSKHLILPDSWLTNMVRLANAQMMVDWFPTQETIENDIQRLIELNLIKIFSPPISIQDLYKICIESVHPTLILNTTQIYHQFQFQQQRELLQQQQHQHQQQLISASSMVLQPNPHSSSFATTAEGGLSEQQSMVVDLRGSSSSLSTAGVPAPADHYATFNRSVSVSKSIQTLIEFIRFDQPDLNQQLIILEKPSGTDTDQRIRTVSTDLIHTLEMLNRSITLGF